MLRASSIDQPLDGSGFDAGDTITFSATATDPNETLSENAYEWTVLFVHNEHTHPGIGPWCGSSGSFKIPDDGTLVLRRHGLRAPGRGDRFGGIDRHRVGPNLPEQGQHRFPGRSRGRHPVPGRFDHHDAVHVRHGYELRARHRRAGTRVRGRHPLSVRILVEMGSRDPIRWSRPQPI